MTLLQAQRILGVTAQDSHHAAKKAWQRLAMRHHPDLGGDSRAFKRLAWAWELVEESFAAPEPAQQAQQAQGPALQAGQVFDLIHLSLNDVEIELPEGAYAKLQLGESGHTVHGDFIQLYIISVHLPGGVKGSSGKVQVLVALPGTQEQGQWTSTVDQTTWNRQGLMDSFTFTPS